MTILRISATGKNSLASLRHTLKDPSITTTRRVYSTRPLSSHSTPNRPPFHPLQTRSYANAMVNTSSSDQKVDYGHFTQLQSFPIEYAPVTLSKWRSERTGLTVVVGNHSSPVTNGYFTIASEIFDDTGRPHTLEHLVFLGSKEYPYKGVLDQLANRAGSNGTNAWTANDHTAYTISTAGSEGFLKMLPIYIDHILHPTITDAGFVTEIHHINGAGEDAGVVYSEMQARENQSGDLMALQAQRLLYPPSSAYRSETGGLMSMLRVLTAQQIRDYHAKYYVPHNLCLLIDGAVPLPELFDILNNQVDPLILSHQANNTTSDTYTRPKDWQRPFVETSTAEPLTIQESQTKVVEFMEEDESMGEVTINWLGAPPTDYRTNSAIKLLGNYLTQSATAPLQKEFIEIPKPYTTSIGIYSEDRVNKNELTMGMFDVPTKHLNDIADLVRAKLAKVVKEEGIDMDRMAMIIRRDKRKLLNYMETSVSSVLSDAVIGDFLYGHADGKELPLAFSDLADYAVFEKYTAQDWINLLDKYFVSAPSLTIIGKPSAALSAKIEGDEKERIAKRKAELGEEKLKELEKKVEEAKKESDVPPPPKMISEFPLTDPSSLTWVPVETAINNVEGATGSSDRGDVQKHVDADGIELPYQTHFSHVKSNFITVTALFDTINLPDELRPYVAIFQTALFSLSVKRSDGSVLGHEEVVNQLNDFTVSQGSDFSYRGCFSEVLTVSMKVEASQYADAVSWIRDLVTGCIFSQDRLSVIVAKMLQELPFEKRQGSSIARAWANKLTYDVGKATSEACALLHSLEFIPAVAEALEKDPESVISKMNEMRQHLLDPSILRVSVAGNILNLAEPKKVLADKFLPIKDSKPLIPISLSSATLTELGKNPAKTIALVPMSAIEGSYGIHYSKGPEGFDHPDLPALTLANATLNAAESYLWKSIRGSGLAYGANVELDVESGLMGFSIYRSPNAFLAYQEGGKILKGLVDGTVELDQNTVDGARALLTYEYARKSETVMAAASTAYLNEVLKGVGKDFDQEMLKRLPGVTLDDIRRVIKQYLLPLFSPETSIGAVSVSSGKADEVEKGFKEMGFTVERKELPMLSGVESDSVSGSEESGSGSESEGEGEESVKRAKHE